MTVGRLRADGILNLLREFEKQETISSQTFQKGVNFANAQSYNTLSHLRQEIADIAVNRVLATLEKQNLESHNTSKRDLFCQNHGKNSSHTTDQCRRVNKTYGYGNRKFFSRSNSPAPSRSPTQVTNKPCHSETTSTSHKHGHQRQQRQQTLDT